MTIAGIIVWHVVIALVTIGAGVRFGLPWPLPSSFAFVGPMLPLAVMSVAALRGRWNAPSWLCFVCGIAVDLMTQGPLGFWALIYLSGTLLIGVVPWIMRAHALGRFTLIVGVAVVTVFLQAGIGWGIYQQAPSGVVLMAGGLAMAGLGIVLELLLVLASHVQLRRAGNGARAVLE
jgi:rod shape-determining protein MreD